MTTMKGKKNLINLLACGSFNKNILPPSLYINTLLLEKKSVYMLGSERVYIK